MRYIIIGERNLGIKCNFKNCTTEQLIRELKYICNKKEEITYHDIDKIHIIYKILQEREVL